MLDGAEGRRTQEKNATQTQNYLFYGSAQEGGIIPQHSNAPAERTNILRKIQRGGK